MVVDFRDRRPEPVLELRLGRFDELALPLERAALREVELGRQDSDIAVRHERQVTSCNLATGVGSD